MKLDTAWVKAQMNKVLDKYNAKKISKALMEKEMGFLLVGLERAEAHEKIILKYKRNTR